MTSTHPELILRRHPKVRLLPSLVPSCAIAAALCISATPTICECVLLPTGAVTAKHAGRNPVVGAAAAWLGIFAPGVLMMFALLPWWSVFRRWPLYRRRTSCPTTQAHVWEDFALVLLSSQQ